MVSAGVLPAHARASAACTIIDDADIIFVKNVNQLELRWAKLVGSPDGKTVTLDVKGNPAGMNPVLETPINISVTGDGEGTFGGGGGGTGTVAFNQQGINYSLSGVLTLTLTVAGTDKCWSKEVSVTHLT